MVIVQVAGHVGSVETKTFASGKSLARFSVGSQSTRKDEQGKFITEWTQFDAWGPTGEYIAKNWAKGDIVQVLAEKQTTKRDDKYFTSYPVIRVERIKKGSANQDGGVAAPAPASNNAAPAAPTIDDEEIPF